MQAELTEIQRAADRAAGLTRQLLAFSRRQQLRPETLDLNEVVVEMGGMLQRLIGDQVELVIDLGPQLRLTVADPTQVQQIVLNLAVNARDAMRDGGRLTIESAPLDLPDHNDYDLAPGRCVMLRVKDTGCGMTPAVQAHLFEPFFTTKESGAGAGLGLATAYGIVAEWGGRIEVEGRTGQGTGVHVILPGVHEAAAGRGEPAESPRKGGERILVVEDELPVRSLVCDYLTVCGYNVVEAPNGDSALELFDREGPIDLLLTDVVMPDENATIRPAMPRSIIAEGVIAVANDALLLSLLELFSEVSAAVRSWHTLRTLRLYGR